MKSNSETVQLVIRVPVALKARLQHAAIDRRVSVSSLVASFVAAALGDSVKPVKVVAAPMSDSGESVKPVKEIVLDACARPGCGHPRSIHQKTGCFAGCNCSASRFIAQKQ
jgi:hypothetical protein